jgi:hypothetical protein
VAAQTGADGWLIALSSGDFLLLARGDLCPAEKRQPTSQEN